MTTLPCPVDECEGELEFEIDRDSEGDSGVINGLRYFWTYELVEQSCDHEYDDKTFQQLGDKAVQDALVSYDPYGL